ncbi:MAG: dUTP diphosphatase [Spirochaetales bacterium]|nr:dUTP diphosphatase [Spirochaetales bacterium]
MQKIVIYGNFESNAEPVYGSAFSSGADVKAFIDNDVNILPGQSVLIPTGMKLQIPVGYEAQIRPRSGLALKNSITVLNTPGTIDSDYRGEIKIILINHGINNFTVKNGDRIAQIVFAPVIKAEFLQLKELSNSDRGVNGFGSTGI